MAMDKITRDNGNPFRANGGTFTQITLTATGQNATVCSVAANQQMFITSVTAAASTTMNSTMCIIRDGATGTLICPTASTSVNFIFSATQNNPIPLTVGSICTIWLGNSFSATGTAYLTIGYYLENNAV